MLFTYALTVDGRDLALRPEEQTDRQSAIDHGEALLNAALDVDRPTAAHMAVFEGDGGDATPLGAWRWSIEAHEPVWAGEQGL